jgi:thymidine kinase
LIRRIKRAQIADQKLEIFKPSADVRYDKENVVSHDTNKIMATPINHSKLILKISHETTVVAIDEAQFFDDGLTDICQELAVLGVRVIVAGLDMDYLGKPFGPMPALLAVAEYVTKVHAICVHCGSLATHSYRLAVGSEVVLLGEKESYEPRCRTCYMLDTAIRHK